MKRLRVVAKVVVVLGLLGAVASGCLGRGSVADL